MTDNVIASSKVWSEDEQAMLARIAVLIIGADPEGVKPAVDDELILPHILERALDFERPVRQGMMILTALLKDEEAGPVMELSDEILNSELQSQRDTRSMLRAMMQVVAQCYYQDARVLASLGFDARPPFPLGHDLEEGDWGLLDEVRNGPARYRSV